MAFTENNMTYFDAVTNPYNIYHKLRLDLCNPLYCSYHRIYNEFDWMYIHL